MCQTYRICLSEPWYVERSHAEGQPIQVYLTGNLSIVCVHLSGVLQQLFHSAGFFMQVSKAPSSESLEQGRVSDSNQVGETVTHCRSLYSEIDLEQKWDSKELLWYVLIGVFQNPGVLKGVMQKVNPFKSTSQVTTAMTAGYDGWMIFVHSTAHTSVLPLALDKILKGKVSGRVGRLFDWDCAFGSVGKYWSIVSHFYLW